MNQDIIVDLQVFQSPAWDRGMGKYTLELMAELNKIADVSKFRVFGILSSRQESPKELNRIIKERLNKIKIVHLDLLEDSIGDRKVPQHNRRMIDKFIADNAAENKNHQIIYFVPSPMQGYICAPMPSDREQLTKVALAHDLIPLAFHDIYLESSITREEYLSRIKDLLRTDIYLTNSKTTANDLAVYLSIDKSRIHNISGGPVNHSVAHQKINITKPFILMPTGNDLRKNNERAVRAFEEFNKQEQHKYKLVITSYFKDYQKDLLNSLSKDLVFTGNINGSKLSYLFKECTALLFPSEYEGLGMPILEALEYNKPIACSDIAVFREMSNSAFTFFNPYILAEITLALKTVTKNPSVDNTEYKRILNKFSWRHTSQKFYNFINGKTSITTLTKKPKLAVFAPNASNISCAGKFCLQAHAEMSRVVSLEYFQASINNAYREQRVDFLSYITKDVIVQRGLGYKPENYKASFFHIDNTEESADILFTALGSRNSYILLQDINLEIVWRRMLAKGLINKDRFEFEKSNCSLVGETKNKSFLTSLLVNSKIIIVFNKRHETTLKKYKAKLSSLARIVYYPLPTVSLPYQRAVNVKSKPYLPVSELKTMGSITDLQLNNILSQVKMLVYDDNKYPFSIILEAIKFGTIPCIPESVAQQLDIPKEVYVNYDGHVNELMIDEATKNISRELIYDFINNRFSYKDLANELTKLIETK